MTSIAGIEVTKPTEAKPNFSMLVYGESGIGKTIFAGSVQEVDELMPALLIDVEGGVLSLRDFYPDIDVLRVKSWAEMQKVYKALSKGEGGYNTVILDSLSETQKFSLVDIMRKVANEDPERDPDVPSMREWGKNLEQMRRMVRLFRDIPDLNTIFTAHAQQETYGKAERTRTKVSLTGKLANEVSGFMDIVLYMYVKTKGKVETRYVLSSQREDVIAKDRTNRLPMTIESPTMQKVFAALGGGPAETEKIDEEAELTKAVKQSSN